MAILALKGNHRTRRFKSRGHTNRPLFRPTGRCARGQPYGSDSGSVTHLSGVDAIKDALTRLSNLPVPVFDWQVRTGFDHTDDPAIWILATIDDDNVKDEKVRFDRRFELRSLIRNAVLKEIDPEKFIYISFRIPSDV